MKPLSAPPVATLRRAMRRFGQRRWKYLGIIKRALAEMADDRDFVVHRGYRLPPRDLRSRMCGNAFRGDDFFIQSAVVEATRLTARLGYKKGCRIVDVGSGLGRLATGMLVEFGEADYLGLDANKEFLEWCRTHIQSYHRSFKFLHVDVVNEMYNPNGVIDGAAIRLPVADGTAEIVYMWGVFTNMSQEHVQIYVPELSRIAAPGGKVFLTAWVEDDVPDVSYNPQGYVPYDCKGPLAVVRFNRQWLLELFSQHGLEIEDYRHHGGMWPKQSELYFVKARTPTPPSDDGLVIRTMDRNHHAPP